MAARSLAGSAAGSGAVVSTAGGTGASGGVSGTGGAAQPLVPSTKQMKALLITQANAQHVDFRLVQAGAQQVQVIEVAGRTDTYAVIGRVVDGYPLDA